MAYNFLDLVNEINRRLNEIELTSNNFLTAKGFYQSAKDAVNSSIRHINHEEFNWPWNHREEEEVLTAGISRYPYPEDAKLIDEKSFRLKRNDIVTASGLVNGATSSSTSVVLDGNIGTIIAGMTVTGTGIDNSVNDVTVASLSDQNNLVLSAAQTLANNVRLTFQSGLGIDTKKLKSYFSSNCKFSRCAFCSIALSSTNGRCWSASKSYALNSLYGPNILGEGLRTSRT